MYLAPQHNEVCYTRFQYTCNEISLPPWSNTESIVTFTDADGQMIQLEAAACERASHLGFQRCVEVRGRQRICFPLPVLFVIASPQWRPHYQPRGRSGFKRVAGFTSVHVIDKAWNCIFHRQLLNSTKLFFFLLRYAFLDCPTIQESFAAPSA